MNTTPEIEMELAALAAAADRANRPASLLTIPFLLLIASILFAAFSYRALASERALVVHRQEEAARLRELVRRIEQEREKEVNLERLYPPAPFFGSHVADEVWRKPEFGFRETPMVSNVVSARADAASQVSRSDITVTIGNEPIEPILRAVDATFNHEFLRGRVFLSQLSLTPTGTGWRAVIRFSVYEKK